MKKLRLLLLGLLVVGIVFWLAGKVGGPPDPQYQGRRLSEVLKSGPERNQLLGYMRGFTDPATAKNEEAIRHMGTNAIPYLLREMKASDSALKIKFRELVSKQIFVSIPFTGAISRKLRAVEAFKVLGSVGEPAIPELIRLLEGAETSDPAAIALAGIRGKSVYAGLALAGIGGKAIPVLINALAHSNGTVRSSAAFALGTTRSERERVVPALIHSLGDKELWVRRHAVSALGEIHQEAALVVPALMECLEDSDTMVRFNACHALKQFGVEAKPAIPALLKALKTFDDSPGIWMEKTIQAIDPEAAARAGIK